MKAKRGVICSLAALAVLLAVVVVMAQWDTARAAGSFNPTMSCSVSDPTAGANADVVRVFDVPAGDYNYKKTVDFLPAEFGMNENLPQGAWAGDLRSVSTLGLLNNLCTTGLDVLFHLYNASVDTSDTVSFRDSYGDIDGNGVLDGVEKYPDFLNTLFPGLTPTIRLFGITSVAGTPVTMNIVVFEPGTSVLGLASDASLGRVIVNVLNNPAAMLAPNAITDFCTPLMAETTLFGITKTDATVTATEGGTPFMTNPTTAGDYTCTTWAVNRLDADGDGLENSIDTCPYDVNSGEDIDKDGIDKACDPNDDVNENGGDYDDDVFANRGDNCPLVANGPNDADNQTDTDGDDIGDACDTNPTTPDGVPIERWNSSTVTIVPAGDVDCDDDVDAVDALFILQYVVGLRSPSDQCPPPEGHLYLPAGDVDCDDDVDAVDALFILQHVVGLRPALGVCGITPTQIIIGAHFSQTGTYGAAFAPVLAGMKAYFNYVNAEEGGVCGRQIILKAEDDEYDPAKSPEVVRKLVEQDKVFAMIAGLGTAAHTAVWEYLNEMGVPDLWIMSGAHKWGATPEEHPWSVGFLPDYYVEGTIFGKYISQNLPGAKVGVLYQNDDYGKDELAGVKNGLDPTKNELVSEQSYEPTAVDIRSLVTNLKDAGAEVVVGACIPGHCAQAIKAADQMGWEPTILIGSVNADPAMFVYAGGPEVMEGVISLQVNKMADWTDDSAVAKHHEIMEQYSTIVPGNFTIFGQETASLTVEALSRTCDNLTRQGLMDAVHSFQEYQPDLMLLGITITLSPTDHLAIEGMRMLVATVTPEGKGKWEYFGPIITFRD